MTGATCAAPTICSARIRKLALAIDSGEEFGVFAFKSLDAFEQIAGSVIWYAHLSLRRSGHMSLDCTLDVNARK